MTLTLQVGHYYLGVKNVCSGQGLLRENNINNSLPSNDALNIYLVLGCQYHVEDFYLKSRKLSASKNKSEKLLLPGRTAASA